MARRLNRRSFLNCVVGSSIVGGGALARIGGAEAQITDQDPTDPRGRGRGSGVTDRDTGPNADPAGRGRGRTAGVTDRDTGANADPAGRGRGRGNGSAPRPCNWRLNGTFEFLQSNNISGEMVLSQNNGRVLGTAYFNSPTMRQRVDGRVEGFIANDGPIPPGGGLRFELRIAWFARGMQYAPDGLRSNHTYDETGIYNGWIDNSGSITGSNSPFNRPRDRTTFFMRQRAMCR